MHVTLTFKNARFCSCSVCVYAVSYTHLDVYKRQIHMRISGMDTESMNLNKNIWIVLDLG